LITANFRLDTLNFAFKFVCTERPTPSIISKSTSSSTIKSSTFLKKFTSIIFLKLFQDNQVHSNLTHSSISRKLRQHPLLPFSPSIKFFPLKASRKTSLVSHALRTTSCNSLYVMSFRLGLELPMRITLVFIFRNSVTIGRTPRQISMPLLSQKNAIHLNGR
jgi:hypothetical protein